jgi:hypothetical protein
MEWYVCKVQKTRAKAGVWQQLFGRITYEKVQAKAMLIDSAAVSAHRHAAGGQQKERNKR